MITYEDPEADRIDDAEIETDDNGVYKVFSNMSSTEVEDPNAEIVLDEEFKKRNTGRQVQILLAALKKQMYIVDETNVKVSYVKKIYSEQQHKIASFQKMLDQKDEEVKQLTEALEEKSQ